MTHIAIHHTATPPTMTPQRIAELHINPDPSRGKEAWPGIGYHFFVHADGSIDQLNHLETVTYHVYRHNEQAVGVESLPAAL
ncbi:MAG: N-acetylmuramoyl-L-alanine amidase [Caldilineaceae bacterium]